jgi:glycerol-3-phosphate dehydrogenase (NAD(P)+)
VRIAVLGAGSWGTTVASLVAPRHDVVLWARDPDVAKAVNTEHANSAYLPGFGLAPELSATADLDEAVCEADLLVMGVPTSGFRGVLEQASHCIRPWIPVVSLSKGLEKDSHLRMTEVVKQVVPGHPVAALTGPNIAHEIMSGKAAAAVIATEDLEVAGAIQKVFTRGLFRVYVNDDLIGCEMGGALKNVIAIAAGIAVGVGLGYNSTAALITRGIVEITRLAVACGARRETLAGLSGVGDLVLTCTGSLSRNRTVGQALGQGRKLPEILESLGGKVAEGVLTTRAALGLARKHGVEMPIAEQMELILNEGKDPRQAIRALMLRPGKEEH